MPHDTPPLATYICSDCNRRALSGYHHCLQDYCDKHHRHYKRYLDGTRDCPDCVEERIADLHRQGANLREDI